MSSLVVSCQPQQAIGAMHGGLSLSVINISRSRDESVFVDAVGTSNLCKLALLHMIMYCRVGSSPTRSRSASSKSPTTKGLLLRPKGAIGRSNRQVSQHDCAGRSWKCCLPYLACCVTSLPCEADLRFRSLQDPSVLRVRSCCHFVFAERVLKSWLQRRGFAFP